MTEYICNHVNPGCGNCKHAVPHKPYENNPYHELCTEHRTVCIGVWSECICEEIENNG